MAQTPRALPGGRGSRQGVGAVGGFALKLIRESVGLTQAGLAVRLGRDVATVQGWESGRRPLTSLRTTDLACLRAKLVSSGAPPDTFATLRDCLDADHLIAAAVDAGGSPTSAREHPLALAVHRHDFTNLITWPFTGRVPPQLRGAPPSAVVRHGPVADRPVLSAEARTRFFDHLLVTAERCRADSGTVLRRQAIYLLGFDERRATRKWLLTEQRDALRTAGHQQTVPAWVAVRSSAVALALDGDQDPLHGFVSRGLRDPEQEAANLNYWAYWTGEIGGTYRDDSFMTEQTGSHWSGERMFAHLLPRLHPDSPHLALNAHTLWALLLARPRVLDRRSELRSAAGHRLERLLDASDLLPGTRRELAQVAYAIRQAHR